MRSVAPIAVAHESPQMLQAEIEAFRALSLAERGRLLAIACRSAARLNRSRLKAGLPDIGPEPWPASTWDFLTKHAPHES